MKVQYLLGLPLVSMHSLLLLSLCNFYNSLPISRGKNVLILQAALRSFFPKLYNYNNNTYNNDYYYFRAL